MGRPVTTKTIAPNLRERVFRPRAVPARELDTDFYRRLEDDPRWAEFRSRHGIEERDLSQVEFNPALPDEILRSMQD